MQTYPITEAERLALVRPAWEELAQGRDAAGPFCTAAWHAAWWPAYGAGRRPLVLVAHDNGNIAGVAPLMRASGTLRGLPVRIVSFMENSAASRCDFVVSGRREAVIEAVLDHLDRCAGWDVLLLRKIPARSETLALLPGLLKRRGMRYAIHESLRSPYLEINQDWERFFAGRSAKLRKDCRSTLRRLQAAGDVEMEEITDLAAFNRALPELCAVADHSWKAPLGTALSSRRHLSFFKLLAAEAAAKGWLSVWTLRLGGGMIAFEFDLRVGDVNHGLKAEFDERYREQRPGSVLHYLMMKALFESGRRGYDHGGSTAFYKMRWTDKCLRHVDVAAFNRRLAGRALHTLEYGAVTKLRQAREWMQKRSGQGNGQTPRWLAVRVK